MIKPKNFVFDVIILVVKFQITVHRKANRCVKRDVPQYVINGLYEYE